MEEPSENETRLDGVLDATADTILAFAAVWLVLAVVVRATTNLVGSPVPETTLQPAVALVAFGSIYPFVTGLWPLGRFLRFVYAAAAVLLALGVVAFVVLLGIGGVPTNSTAVKLLEFGIVAVALVVAGAMVILGNR